jgi:hypothetical protein
VLGFCAKSRSDRRKGYDLRIPGCEGNRFECGTDILAQRDYNEFIGGSNSVALIGVSHGVEYQNILVSEGKENAEVFKQNQIKKSCMLKAKATERLINRSYDRCCANNTWYSAVVNGIPVIECRVEFCLAGKQRQLNRYIQGDHPTVGETQRLQSICLEQNDVKSIINNL